MRTQIAMVALLLTFAVAITIKGRDVGSAARADTSNVAEWATKYRGMAAARISTLLREMETADLEKLPPITMEPYTLPQYGVDVMRVKLEEHYSIQGIGEDSVQLSGWIAVIHSDARPAYDTSTVTWDTAVSDTEFVGLDLQGTSKLFGPVQVKLDTSVASLGQVGEISLPFALRTVLDASYAPYRQPLSVRRIPAFAAQNRGNQPPPRPVTPPALTGDRKSISDIVDTLVQAIQNKDAQALVRLYAPGANNDFFGPTGVQHGSQRYVDSLQSLFGNMRSIRIQRNNDMKIVLDRTLANVTMTGANDVVDTQGRSGNSPWSWTLQLQKTGQRWLISHDHLSFITDPSRPVGAQGLNSIQDRGKCCLANLQVSVLMPKLNLAMRTSRPVQWYSEVDTIPPVGRTASVSLTPTPLLMGSRVVGALTSGSVNFREVVRHVDLMDTLTFAAR